MGIKVSTNLTSLRSKIQRDLIKKREKVNLDKIGQYLVEKIKEEATNSLINLEQFEQDGKERIEYGDLIEMITYKVITHPDGTRSIRLGVFDNAQGARLMEEIEYGSLRNPEVPIFRTVVPAMSEKIIQYIKNGKKLL
jgi:hypothetical protein